MREDNCTWLDTEAMPVFERLWFYNRVAERMHAKERQYRAMEAKLKARSRR